MKNGGSERSAHSKWAMAFAGITLIPMLFAGVEPDAARAVECPRGQLIDYSKPLRSLPAVRKLPADGHPKFAPQGIKLEALGNVVVGSGSAGFRLSANASRPYRLNWLLEMEAFSLSPGGAVIRKLTKRTFRLTDLRAYARHPAEFVARLPRLPGFYRVDLSIKNLDGTTLGNVEEYFRAVPRTFKARIAISPPNIQAGGTIFSRIENRGTAGISLGVFVDLEQRVNSGWMRIPFGPEWGPPVAFEIPGGSIAPCQRLKLPADLLPGIYRLSKKVSSGGNTRVVHSNPITVN